MRGTRLARHRSFSAAARDLDIKQSTASKWIAELEAQLGVRLVERTTRSLHLTEAGQRMLAHASDLLSGFDEMSAELRAQSPEPSGRLRISVPVVFGRRFVVPALAGFLRSHPQVEAELLLGDRYVNLVDEGFDLAVRVGVPIDTSARTRKLAESRRRLVASPEYVAAHGRLRTPAELEQHECLVHGEIDRAVVWRFGPKRGREQPVAVRGRIAANNSEAILEMARAGLGIALLADWLVADDLAQGRLIALLGEYAVPAAPIMALSPPGRFPSPAVRVLTDHLARELGFIVQSVYGMSEPGVG